MPYLATPQKRLIEVGIWRKVLNRRQSMKCPACGHEQQEGLTECQKCSLIFSKWQSKQNAVQPGGYIGSPMSSPAPSEKPGILSGLFSGNLFTVVIGIVALAGLWILFVPKPGLPVPEGAYVNTAEHFAVLFPADWQMNTVENYEFQRGQAPGGFALALRNHLFNEDPNVSDFMNRKKDAVGFLMTYNKTGGESGRAQPFFNLVSFKAPLPGMSDSNKEEFSKVLAQALNATQGYTEYIQESAEIVSVDNLPVLKTAGRAKAQVEVAPQRWTSFTYGLKVLAPASYQPADIRLVQYLVPGGSKNYLITYGADPADFNFHQTQSEESVSRFRVASRISFHSILKAYREWALWLLCVLVAGAFRWVFNR